jgi:MSHA biogenesis protein MshP
MTSSLERIVRATRFSAGVGLVTAIFLLVVLAGLGTAMVTIFSTQQTTAALDVQGARAYQAARAGIEWGLYQVLHNNSTCDDPTPIAVALPSNTSLSGFTVKVSCQRVGNVDDPIVRYIIKSAACWEPGGDGTCTNASNNRDYVARRLEVEL